MSGAPADSATDPSEEPPPPTRLRTPRPLSVGGGGGGNTILELFLSRRVCLIGFGSPRMLSVAVPSLLGIPEQAGLAQAWGALSLRLRTQCRGDVGRREGGSKSD